jgi:hypothetical protein
MPKIQRVDQQTEGQISLSLCSIRSVLATVPSRSDATAIIFPSSTKGAACRVACGGSMGTLRAYCLALLNSEAGFPYSA